MLLDLDAFFASVEQMDHPEWKGKPVIVGGDPAKRGVVSTCSYEARTFGVKSAMPSSLAAQLCPDAIWTPGRFSRYREVSRQVMSILYDESPFMQQVSVDEAFLDITPGAHVAEHPIDIASRIQQRVNALGITCSIGLGTSKTIAKIASDMDKPRGFTVVFPGQEEEFLAPLPISCMSGIGQVTQKRLKQYGIQTLGQLARTDGTVLEEAFGKNATMMRNRCLGLDSTPVASDDEVKSISNEMSFANDITSAEDVKAAIETATFKVCRRLRKKQMKATSLTLKIKFHNMKQKTAQAQLHKEMDSEFDMIPQLLKLLSEIWDEGVPLRLVGVSAGGFGKEVQEQASLFDMSSPEETPARKKDLSKLAKATDIIRDRFGESAVSFGAEQRTRSNLTGTGSKNPEDYK